MTTLEQNLEKLETYLTHVREHGILNQIGDEAQARALHVYLMGLTIRNRTAPLADAEIARAVSALTSTEVGAANLA